MKNIFAAGVFALLTGCASGTINTLSADRYECSAIGSFFDFSADNAIEACRKNMEDMKVTLSMKYDDELSKLMCELHLLTYDNELENMI